MIDNNKKKDKDDSNDPSMYFRLAFSFENDLN